MCKCANSFGQRPFLFSQTVFTALAGIEGDAASLILSGDFLFFWHKKAAVPY
jgi:hypothetical protein